MAKILNSDQFRNKKELVVGEINGQTRTPGHIKSGIRVPFYKEVPSPDFFQHNTKSRTIL
jgi:hypothetical protein